MQGRQYTNRAADLGNAANQKAQPAVAPKGLPYGQHQQLVQSQQQMPLPNAQATDTAAIMEAARNFDLNSAAAAPLHRPTERPTEPITAGAAVGPGPGPEMLGPSAVGPPASLTDLLRSLAPGDPSGTIAAMANQAAGLGQ